MEWLIRRGRVPYLLLLSLATAYFGLYAARLRVDDSNESMSARSEAQLRVYPEFKRTFGSDEDLLLSVTRDDLLTTTGLQFVDGLTRRLSQLAGVVGVDSLTTVHQIVSGRDGAEDRLLITAPLDEPQVGGRLRAALDWNPHLTGLLISTDRRTAGLIIHVAEDEKQEVDPGPLIAAVRKIISDESTPAISLHLTGIMVQKYDVGQLVHKDEQVLVPLSAVVLGVALALFFRRLSGVVLPLLVTAISVIWTMGAYGVTGLPLNPVTSLLPPVVMVLSISTSVHLYHGWLRHPAAETTVARLIGIIRNLRAPCFLAALTTALGFGSLCANEIPAVRYFGFFAAFGVMVSFIVGMSLIPVLLSFLRPPAPPAPEVAGGLLSGALPAVAEICIRYPGRILALAAGLSVVSAAGAAMITSNTDLVRFLKSGAPLYRDTMFIDRHLSGPNNLELVVSRTDGEPLTSGADVERLAKFRDAVSKQEDVAAVYSIVSLLEQLHRAETGGRTLQAPTDENDLAAYFELLESSDQQALVRRLIDPTFKKARIRVNVHAIGSAVAGRLIDTLRNDGRQILGPGYSLTVTGSFFQVVEDSNHLVRNQVATFGLAFVLVFLACGFLFRSLKLMTVSLVVNLLPVLWTAGAMGFAGIELSTGTVMIASVVIGIAVDDTIHYLTRFVRERSAGCVTAIRRSTREVGPAMITSSLVLTLGFWVGCLGSFRPTIYFSLMTGATMLTALACDLFLLPAGLMLFERRNAASET